MRARVCSGPSGARSVGGLPAARRRSRPSNDRWSRPPTRASSAADRRSSRCWAVFGSPSAPRLQWCWWLFPRWSRRTATRHGGLRARGPWCSPRSWRPLVPAECAWRYGPPGQRRDRNAFAAGDRALHRIYPAHVNPRDPNDVRLDADPYSNVQPYGWVLAGVVGAALLIAGRIAWWRAANRLVRQGPWYAIDHVCDEGFGEVGLVVAGEPAPLASRPRTCAAADGHHAPVGGNDVRSG